jgi:hypothetical protein
MNNSELWATWSMWLIVAAVIVVIAAILLLLVWWTAQRILKGAVAALTLVKQIKANTGSIWALEDTNKTALQILANADAIKRNGAAVAQALHSAEN